MPSIENIRLRHMLELLSWSEEDSHMTLRAFPEFQKRILITYDDPEFAYRCFNVTNVPPISVWDYDKLVREGSSSPQYCLKVFCYAYAEEKWNSADFNESRNCLYTRHLDETSLVYMRTFYKDGSAILSSMTRHIVRANAWSPSAFICRPHDLPKSWVRFDGRHDRKLDSIAKGVGRWDSNKLNPPFTTSSVNGRGHLTAKRLHPITTLFAEDYITLDLEKVYLPWVNKAMVDFDDTDRNSETPSFDCQLPRLRNFYVKYYGRELPRIGGGSPWHTIGRHNLKQSKAKFTLVNQSWVPHAPHIERTPSSQVSHEWGMYFLSNFGIITFKGIPDMVFTQCPLTETRELYWERATHEGTIKDMLALNLFAPKLEKLSLCSAVEEDGQSIPTFECPKLKSLKLVSLVGSDIKWDLQVLLQDSLPQKLTSIEFNGFWWVEDDEDPMTMTSEDLAFVATKVEKLSVKGYRPDFVLSQSGKDVERLEYTKLKDLTIDVTRIPLCCGAMASSPEPDVLMVDLFNASFPALERVSLVVPYGGSTGVLEQARKISLFVSPDVKAVQLSSTLVISDRALEINGVRIVQGECEDVPETYRSGRLWERSKAGAFQFSRVVVLEEWEDCCLS